MESLYPPELNKTQPAARVPTIRGPLPCSRTETHDYVNVPKADTVRRYVNVEPMLSDPAVQRAKRNLIADSAEKAASGKRQEEPKYVNLEMLTTK